MAEGAVTGANPNWTPAQARLMKARAQEVMAQRNQEIGVPQQPPIFSGSKVNDSGPARSAVVPNDAQPQANAPQLNKQQQRIVEYYQNKLTEAGQQAQKTGDYSGMKAIQQEAQQACQQAGIPPEAMQ